MSMNNEPFAIVQVRLTAILPLCIDKLGKGSAFPGEQKPFLMINSLKQNAPSLKQLVLLLMNIMIQFWKHANTEKIYFLPWTVFILKPQLAKEGSFLLQQARIWDLNSTDCHMT